MIDRGPMERLSAKVPGGHVIVRCVVFSQVRDCGCRVYLGRREDNDEPATVAVPCSDDHKPVMLRFNELYIGSLNEDDGPDGGRPAIMVIDEVLQKAAAA